MFVCRLQCRRVSADCSVGEFVCCGDEDVDTVHRECGHREERMSR